MRIDGEKFKSGGSFRRYTMKAISLWQPWATAIAIGSKRMETRGWPTSYRGPLAIHAAKRKVNSELWSLESQLPWRGAMYSVLGGVSSMANCLPFGAIVSVCRIVDCIPSEELQDIIDDVRYSDEEGPRKWARRWTERNMGDFGPGRFGWILEDVKAIEPIPFRGSQRFFEVPDDILSIKSPRLRPPATMNRDNLTWRQRAANKSIQ